MPDNGKRDVATFEQTKESVVRIKQEGREDRAMTIAARGASMNAESVFRGLPAGTTIPDRRRFEHWFFSGMSLLILATIYYGFARSYFLAGMFRAHLPNLLIHVHAAIFTGWIFLLVAQTTLVASGQVRWHRRLGVAGFFLACAMVVVGSAAATESTLRGGPPGLDPLAFYYNLLSTVLIGFPLLVYLAFRFRSNPPAHKRLILIATLVLVDAGIIRWPIRWIAESSLMTSAVVYSFLLLIIVYDLWSTRRVHPATLWGGAFLVLFRETEDLIGGTRMWHLCATWLLHFWQHGR